MGQGPQKPDRGGNFYVMPRKVIASPAWRHASLRARVVLDVFLARHNGFNNGKLGLGIKDIGKEIGSQNHGANSRAVAELIEHGFLECVSSADRHQAKTREFRITFLSSGEGKKALPATNEYLDWRPSPMQLRQFGGARTATRSAISVAVTATQVKFPVAVTATPDAENRAIADEPRVAVTAPLLVNHSPPNISSPATSAIHAIVAPKPVAAPIGVELDELRAWAKDAISRFGYGGQKKLAQDAEIAASALCRFLSGRSLPAQNRMALQMACGRILPHNKWKEAA